MQYLIDLLSQPWAWYIAGPIIGCLLPLMLFIDNKPFGISKSFEHFCAMTQPKHITVSYFQYNWKKHDWAIIFVLGITLGGFIAGQWLTAPDAIQLSNAADSMFKQWGISRGMEMYPKELFSVSIVNLIILFVGGVLTGFGTRYASGCTSGHAITGLATLQIKSLYSVIGIFGGALLAAHLITPLLFEINK